MKRLFAVVLLSLPSPTIAATLDDTCAYMGEMAEINMTERQNGVPVADLKRFAEERWADDPSAKGLALSLIDIAYNRERMQTEQGRRAAIGLFRSNAEALCYKKGSD